MTKNYSVPTPDGWEVVMKKGSLKRVLLNEKKEEFGRFDNLGQALDFASKNAKRADNEQLLIGVFSTRDSNSNNRIR